VPQLTTGDDVTEDQPERATEGPERRQTRCPDTAEAACAREDGLGGLHV